MAWRKPANLREWIKVLTRHKKKLLFPALIAMIAVVLASYRLPRDYRAEAKFQRLNDHTLDVMGSGGIRSTLNPIRQALQEDLKGRAAIEQLVEDLQLTRDLPHTPDGQLTLEGQLAKYDLIQRLQKRVSVSYQIRSDQMDHITVAYTDSRPDLPPRIVNRLVENYMSKTRAQLSDVLLRSKTYFEREVDRFRAQEQEAQNRVLAFRAANPNLNLEDPGSVREGLALKRSELADVMRQLDLARGERENIEVWIRDQPDTIEEVQTGPNPELLGLRERLAVLERQLDEHRNIRRTDEHPLVKTALVRIAELEARIAQTPDQVEVARRVAPNDQKHGAQLQLQRLSGNLEALVRQRDQLDEQVQHLDTLDRNFFGVRNEYVGYQRRLDEAQSNLRFWVDKLHRTSLTLAAEVNNQGVRLSFISPAQDVPRPSSPSFKTILAAALAAGLGVGALLVLLAELLDHSCRTIDQAVDELKLPVLGAVTEIVTPIEAFRRKLVGYALFPAMGMSLAVVFLACAWAVFLSLDDPHRYDQLMKSPRAYLSDVIDGVNR